MNMIVVAVASGVVLMPALNTPVVNISSTERRSWKRGARLTAISGSRGAATMMAITVAKKKRAQVTCTKRVGFEQQLHQSVERDEAEHRPQHPQDAACSVFSMRDGLGGDAHGRAIDGAPESSKRECRGGRLRTLHGLPCFVIPAKAGTDRYRKREFADNPKR